jgi:hypothetical protein
MTFPDIALAISFFSVFAMLLFVSYDAVRRPLIK